MGMTYCDHHGLTGITTCCEHVRVARDAERFEHVNIALNGWAEPILVCDRCLEQTQAQLAANRAADVRGWFYELAPRERYACGDCLREWHTATGQGDLIAQCRRARAEVGIDDFCEAHGEVEPARCCVHIAAAVKDEHRETAHVELDGWSNPTIVCDRCLEQTRARRDAAGGRSQWRFDLEPPERYPCEAHVKEWLLATGQGALTDKVDDR